MKVSLSWVGSLTGAELGMLTLIIVISMQITHCTSHTLTRCGQQTLHMTMTSPTSNTE